MIWKIWISIWGFSISFFVGMIVWVFFHVGWVGKRYWELKREDDDRKWKLKREQQKKEDEIDWDRMMRKMDDAFKMIDHAKRSKM